jgi:hypothetical protein
MKDLTKFKEYRIINDGLIKLYGEKIKSSIMGAFAVPYKNTELKLLASIEKGWDHISVSLPNRCPTWEEMDYIKHMFFKENEVAFQYHVTKENHINIHPNCLHLWRPQKMIILLPPKTLV